MKKIIDFLLQHWIVIIAVIAVAGIIVSFFVPLLVIIFRDMWDLAINNPFILRQ